MEFKIQRSSRTKNLKIKIDQHGNIVVSAPYYVTTKECKHFVDKHTEWINSTLQKIKVRNIEIIKIKNEMEGKIQYLGKLYTTQTDNSIKEPYILNSNEVILKNNNHEIFYKNEAKRIVIEKCQKIAPFYNVSYKKIRFASQKTRWGSYSTSGTLSFNYNLIKAPSSIIEYVVIHELCHILHHNHSKNFWNEVSKLCPDYMEKRAWLKKNSILLSS